ncbi:hypothetical protein DPMN_157520 [Dreissena polymorpha]|uniref:Uncharacterized protein n=1 Tax=Dreissena polymorpha TaxID=45954 RepID=A0A9D4EI16_DREPO|nr:hypothetical protein DPMN_157520 [Dreissena polymorpha]
MSRMSRLKNGDMSKFGIKRSTTSKIPNGKAYGLLGPYKSERILVVVGPCMCVGVRAKAEVKDDDIVRPVIGDSSKKSEMGHKPKKGIMTSNLNLHRIPTSMFTQIITAACFYQRASFKQEI